MSTMAAKTDKQAAYKLKEYVKMGFTDYQARRLVDVQDLTVVQIRKVLREGCSVNVAYRIYRP